MRRLAMFGALALALSACGNDSVGDRDGACTVADGFLVGDYRCNSNQAQVCTEPENPAKDLPMWRVLDDCDWASSGGFGGGTCVLEAGGVAVCVRRED